MYTQQEQYQEAMSWCEEQAYRDQEYGNCEQKPPASFLDSYSFLILLGLLIAFFIYAFRHRKGL